MVVVYSGDGPGAPDWSNDSPAPPSSSPSLGELEAELQPTRTTLMPVAPAGVPAAGIPAPALLPEPAAEQSRWAENEPGSRAQPVAAIRAQLAATAPADRLTPLGPPWSEPAPALPAEASATVQRRLPRRWATVLAAGLALAAAIALWPSGDDTEPAPTATKERERSGATRVEPPAPTPALTPPAMALAASPPATPAPAPSTRAPNGNAAQKPLREPSTRAPEKNAARSNAIGTTRVRLIVHPPDAKVGRRGYTQKGPPYEFEVPKGKRIALEVVKKGYVTRKVVLDGSAPRVTVGLTKSRTPTQRSR